MSDRPAVAIYAALSRKKPKRGDEDRRDEESVDSQVAKAKARLDQVYGDGGYDLLGPFSEVGHSGSKKNRGPELERAIAAVTEAAESGRQVVELWANTSARFARGTGKRNEARAVGELFYDMRRRGVALRTVEDDEFVTNEMLVGFASAQASKYSDDLGESVKRAKRRQAERGERLGGPLPLGYVNAKPPPLDPEHAPTVERIFELAASGVPDSALARAVNAEGYRTRSGRPFDRRAIQAIVCNGFYAGLIAYEGEEFDAEHEPIIDRDVWRTIQRQRERRDLGHGRHKAGRPARRHLLTGLATCGVCGSPMYTSTSAYKRKDGSRARQYQCRGYRSSDGTCDVRFEAEAADTAVIERLHKLLPDFVGWIGQIEDRNAGDRQRLVDVVGRAEHDRDAQTVIVEKHERRYRQAVADDHPKADLLLDFVQQARQDLAAAETRLTATRDALASVPTEAPRDALLDFATSLRDAIASKVERAHSVEAVNRILVANFEAFRFHPPGDPESVDPTDFVLDASSAWIEPVLRAEVVEVITDRQLASGHAEPEPAPPMAWIAAVHNSDHSHE